MTTDAGRAGMNIDAMKELLSAVEAVGAMPEGFCFCSADRIGDESKIHEPECRDLRAALASMKGEADG